MRRLTFVLAALVAAGALAILSVGDLDALESEVERAENFLSGPSFDPSKPGRLEWQIPPSMLVISEGLVEVSLGRGVHGPSGDGELPRTWTLEVYTLGEDGTHHDAMLHPKGTESHGPRTFSFTGTQEQGRPVAPKAMAYLSRGAPLHVAVEVVDADPALSGGTVEIRAAPDADAAAPGVIDLARALQRTTQALGVLALLVMCVLYFRSTAQE